MEIPPHYAHEGEPPATSEAWSARRRYAAALRRISALAVTNDADAMQLDALTAQLDMPFFYTMGWIYLASAVIGGGYFIYHNIRMVRDPSPRVAMKSFLASLAQLVLLLIGAVVDVLLLG